LEKTYILYNEIEVEGELVDCIYLDDGNCRAQPHVANYAGERANYYRPNEEERKHYCGSLDFTNCPRYKAYQSHLSAIGLKKAGEK
jgi:hypothetical protein